MIRHELSDQKKKREQIIKVVLVRTYIMCGTYENGYYIL
jgi:hypothetical protein